MKACHDLSEGGLAVAISEMALAGGLGADLNLLKLPSNSALRDDFLLFSESNSRFLVEVAEKDKETFEVALKGKAFAEIGRVTKNTQVRVIGLKGSAVVDSSVTDLLAAWKQALSREA